MARRTLASSRTVLVDPINEYVPSTAITLRRLRPFAGAALLGALLAAVPAETRDVVELGAAFALTALVVSSALVLPWRRLPSWTRVIPPFGYVAAVVLMRDASGGATSGFGVLLLLPVFWLALYGTRRQLLVLIAGIAVAFYAPLLLVGGSSYPATGWRTGALFVLVAAVIGLSTQQLISRLRALLVERADLLARFERLAATDPLTELLNRRAWNQALERAISHAARSGQPLSLAVLDLDRFKRLNDLHGHQHGDHVLREWAQAWSARMRGHDVLARIGGEEFGLLLDSSLEDAVTIVDRLRAIKPYDETCSAGVTEWDRHESAEELIARADDLLYRAKTEGRDRTVADRVAGSQPAPANR